MKKKTMFKNENKGVIEVFFTPDEIISMLEVLSFTRRLCESFLAQKDPPLSEEKRDLLKSKVVDASLLEEKIKLDSDPGRPEGLLN